MIFSNCHEVFDFLSVSHSNYVLTNRTRLWGMMLPPFSTLAALPRFAKAASRYQSRANPSSSAAPCDYPQTSTCGAADDDSSEQTGGLRRERIAAGAG